MDWLRAEERRSRLHEEAGLCLEEAAAEECAQTDESVERAIGALSPERRSLVFLRYSAGLDIGAIAEVLDIPEGTVKSRLHRTVEELRQRVRRYENE
jgi:RNA polymerase sigma-70 factor (ECF subfamily)